MTMTRVWLAHIDARRVAFTSEAVAIAAGFTDAEPILLLDGPIPSARSWVDGGPPSRQRYVFQPPVDMRTKRTNNPR